MIIVYWHESEKGFPCYVVKWRPFCAFGVSVKEDPFLEPGEALVALEHNMPQELAHVAVGNVLELFLHLPEISVND